MENIIAEDLKIVQTGYTPVETVPTFPLRKDPDEPLATYLYDEDMDKKLALLHYKDLVTDSYEIQYYRSRPWDGNFSAYRAKTENLNDNTVAVEDAKEVANTICKSLGYEDWELVNIGAASMYYEQYMRLLMGYPTFEDFCNDREFKTADTLPECFCFTYTPKFNGIPLLYCSNTVENESSYAPPRWQPALHIGVDEGGVKGVSLVTNMSVSKTVNENVALLGFDRICEIFREYIKMSADFSFSNVAEKGSSHLLTTININDIRLGYVNVLKKDATKTESILLPTWAFYGTQRDMYDKQSGLTLDENGELALTTKAGHAFLCINAIDGSIIDLSQGY